MNEVYNVEEGSSVMVAIRLESHGIVHISTGTVVSCDQGCFEVVTAFGLVEVAVIDAKHVGIAYGIKSIIHERNFNGDVGLTQAMKVFKEQAKVCYSGKLSPDKIMDELSRQCNLLGW